MNFKYSTERTKPINLDKYYVGTQQKKSLYTNTERVSTIQMQEGSWTSICGHRGTSVTRIILTAVVL